MMRRFTAAVVGTGFIGPVHVEGLQRAGVAVRGILGITAEASALAAQRLGLDVAYGSLDEILADSAVDVVHLATPNRLHFAQASAVLRAGKHVVCEKPLAMNSRESAELVRLARQTGLSAAVNYNIRYYPLCLELAQQVRSGAFGRLFHLSGSYVQDWLLRDTDFNWRVLDSEGGELRAVADIGTHWLDLVQFIAGAHVTAVCADLQTVHPVRRRPAGSVETFGGGASQEQQTIAVPITTEDFGSVLLRFENDIRGVLWVSQVTAGRKNCLRLEVAGEKQAAAWDSEHPNDLWLGHRERANEALIRDPALLSSAARRHASYPGGHNEGFPDTFKQCFRAFYGELDRGSSAPSYPTFLDGHREILICEAIVRSHREQRWVPIEESAV